MSDASEYSRRDLLRHIGISLTMGTAGEYVLAAQDVQHVHQAVAQEKAAQKGRYMPKGLNAHEYATLQRLSDFIIPADEHSPGALAANAADFIDFLCSGSDEMKLIYTGGLAWLDEATRHRYGGKEFLGADPAQQTAMLDLIAYRENRRADPSLGPGIDFFNWARKMIADAYYTSPIGIKDLGYMGNTAMTHFSVPQEAIDYAVKRSPFA
ncbi:putative Tat pathway signal sequence domain-containing protein [Candidatus Sulfopaludibacter sp. SbA3]|nr:putative Tat pathway signal sequence domain-containing protein [Candidatus Sulfopaludibacter sp. SbA3]